MLMMITIIIIIIIYDRGHLPFQSEILQYNSNINTENMYMRIVHVRTCGTL